MNDIPTLIQHLGSSIARMMEQAGLDPTDPTSVDAFVNGMRLTTRIKEQIIDVADDE